MLLRAEDWSGQVSEEGSCLDFLPLSIKARRFSRQHNRIVKQDSSDSEDEEWETPKPFYQLLAEKLMASQDQAQSLAPPRD